MKSFLLLLLFTFIMINQTPAQTDDHLNMELPYRQIPDAPEAFTPGNVASRMVDGLGYRYYWATEGLKSEDLNYKPSEDGRTTRETIEHIYGLSRTIVNAPQNKVNSAPEDSLSFDELRKRTLENLEMASTLLKKGKEGDMEKYKIIFKNGENTSEFPFWNMLNGPIADAIYHTGQVVAFRRASGNPINPGVRVFTGKTAE